MFELLSAQEMKQADLDAVKNGTPASALIAAAAAGLAAAIERHAAPCRILFLCGAGNNGADGFVAAQRLAEKTGWQVRVACLVKKNALKNDAATAAKIWTGDTESLNSNLPVHQTDLIVDGVFGTGYKGALPPELVILFDKIRARKIPVIAVDVPSGMDATTGTIAEGALKADVTVAFCRKKIAHALQTSRAFCGKLHLVTIPIADADIAALGTQVFENNPALWLADFPLPSAEMHKYDRGHVMVYGGVQTGAACLAAHAAQRAGAGVVSITTQPDTHTVYSLYRASIMTPRWQTVDDFKSLLRDTRKNVVVLGPGAGADTHLRDATLAALALNKTCVLDADVFTAFKDDPKTLFAALSPRHILTPHEGEFVRLFGQLEGSKLDRARQAAKRANAIIVLKGADTIIAAPDGTSVINPNGTPILATAGAGDVLAGLISGFAAQGMPSFMACLAAVWLQAEAARTHGLGLTAEDIISQIPQALNRIFMVSIQDT